LDAPGCRAEAEGKRALSPPPSPGEAALAQKQDTDVMKLYAISSYFVNTWQVLEESVEEGDAGSLDEHPK
jgi:hypothetical protein